MTVPTLTVPESTAKEADRRAKEIFDREAAFSKPFVQCLGMIYMVGVQAGIDAAMKDRCAAENSNVAREQRNA